MIPYWNPRFISNLCTTVPGKQKYLSESVKQLTAAAACTSQAAAL